MSIDRETFENSTEDELEGFSVPDQVLGFLGTHEDRAFKAREIATQIGIDEGAVTRRTASECGVRPVTSEERRPIYQLGDVVFVTTRSNGQSLVSSPNSRGEFSAPIWS